MPWARVCCEDLSAFWRTFVNMAQSTCHRAVHFTFVYFLLVFLFSFPPSGEPSVAEKAFFARPQSRLAKSALGPSVCFQSKMEVTNRWLPIPCTPVLPVASIAHASARMAAASSSPSPSLLEGEDRVNVAGDPSDDELPAALPSFVASPPRLVLLWVPGALGRGVDCAGPPASSKFSLSLFNMLVCLLCAQPIEKKFYRCIVCKRKALVNLIVADMHRINQ